MRHSCNARVNDNCAALRSRTSPLYAKPQQQHHTKQAPSGLMAVDSHVDEPMTGIGQETVPNGACDMRLRRTTADVLNNHTTLEVESLDRIDFHFQTVEGQGCD